MLIRTTTNNFAISLLKQTLFILIKKFGLQSVNDQIAQIFYEESNSSENAYLDKISEAYDEINRKLILFKDYKK